MEYTFCIGSMKASHRETWAEGSHVNPGIHSKQSVGSVSLKPFGYAKSLPTVRCPRIPTYKVWQSRWKNRNKDRIHAVEMYTRGLDIWGLGF